MKKQLLLFALLILAFSLTGCDPQESFYYEFRNNTDTDMIVEIEGRKSVNILPGETKMVHHISIMGEWDGEPFRGDKVLRDMLEVRINGDLMSNNIWLRDYWDFQIDDKHHSTYTLTVTEELIQTLLSENNSNN